MVSTLIFGDLNTIMICQPGMVTDNENGIWVSKGGEMNVKHIFHLDTSVPRTEKEWSVAIQNCLTRCEQMEASSIAFPAIGTGKYKI